MPAVTLDDAPRDYLTILAEPFPCQECRHAARCKASLEACAAFSLYVAHAGELRWRAAPRGPTRARFETLFVEAQPEKARTPKCPRPLRLTAEEHRRRNTACQRRASSAGDSSKRETPPAESRRDGIPDRGMARPGSSGNHAGHRPACRWASLPRARRTSGGGCGAGGRSGASERFGESGQIVALTMRLVRRARFALYHESLEFMVEREGLEPSTPAL